MSRRITTHKWFLVGCCTPLMRLAEHLPHGASRLVHAMFAWSVKTLRAPPGHNRNAKVYDRTTMTMHGMSTHTLPI